MASQQKQWNLEDSEMTYSKYSEERKNCQPRVLYLANLSFKKEVNTRLSEINKTERNFASRFALQEIFRWNWVTTDGNLNPQEKAKNTGKINYIKIKKT